MRKVFILCLALFISTVVYSQEFYTTDNLVLKQITESEYRNAYENKVPNKYKRIENSKKCDRILKRFIKNARRELGDSHLFDDLRETDDPFGRVDIYFYKIKSKFWKSSYLAIEDRPVLSHTYYMNGKTVYEMKKFGLGDLDNNQIYFAAPDFDCDQHLWFRWYSFTDNKLNLLAELEDNSFEYDSAVFYDIPCFFADNKGHYYIVFYKNPNIYSDHGDHIFYEIQIVQ